MHAAQTENSERKTLMALTFEEVKAKPALMDYFREYFLEKFRVQLRAEYMTANRRAIRAEEKLRRLQEESRNTNIGNMDVNDDSGRMWRSRWSRTEESGGGSRQATRRLTDQQIQNALDRLRGRRY